MEMTITRALAELKMLDKRINRTISDSILCGIVVGKKPMTGYQNIEEIEQKAKSDYQSANDLISRRNKIKSAIVVSNATTNVEVAGEKMTVAEAIERKTSIDYDKSLLARMKKLYTHFVNQVDTVNAEVQIRLDRQLEVLYGKEGKVKAGENTDLTKLFLEENEAKFIDPLKIKDKIKELTDRIEDFENEIDFVLSEINTITRITIED